MYGFEAPEGSRGAFHGIDGKKGIYWKKGICDFHDAHSSQRSHVFGKRVATTASIVRALVAIVESGPRHSFAQTALFEEFLFQGLQLLI